ncbi:hypothetical protein LWI28_009660 [Acer negundo]|uniref:Uncharacterized protein n=1 Tax=Acer negundo TaxID=4023 RepID=A0AAD5IM09_ACENE|nr:hypothetical protein LWI28_009660 [Acer negundo]KAK4842287.1 hypothetical protein QYF36_019163 [Acer negundo]
MISNKNVANVVGGKTARACDSCIKKRARWYCAADDAFLCQACDASVHSANPLARRHERVRLKTASHKSEAAAVPASSPPSWHGGFTRKARTPRHGKFSNKTLQYSLSLVPELTNSDEISHEENEEEHLLYRVPIYDPFAAELCTKARNYNEVADQFPAEIINVNGSSSAESKVVLSGSGDHVDGSLHGFQFLPTDMELAEFAADVESLLGGGLEKESFVAMEELGLVDYNDNNNKMMECSSNNNNKMMIKVEEELLGDHDHGGDGGEGGDELMREPFELNFDYDSDDHQEEEEEEKVIIKGEVVTESSVCEEDGSGRKAKKKKRKILLRLDYEAVIGAWATTNQGTSPWTTGDRPDFDPDDCWPDCMGTRGTELHHPYIDFTGIGTHHPAVVADVGREARVSRYREKRRTRLFSKKIRYEVRKLNAEKRPRMKGRFVKRASFAGAGPPPPPPVFPNLFNK